MERRVLFAIFLCFLVLYLWQALVVKPVPKPGAAGTPATAQGTKVPGPPGVPSPTAPGEPGPPGGAQPVKEGPAPAPAAAAVVGEAVERDVRVETPTVVAVFTNRGARLKSWKLKRFLDKQKQPQELVESALEPLPFTLRTPEAQANATLNSALYAVNGAPSDGGSPSTGADLRFEYRDTAGVQAVKEFHLDPASYLVTLRANAKIGD